MASVLLQKTPYGSFGGQPGGVLSQTKRDQSPSITDKEELPLTAEELARSLAEKDAIGPPTVGPISIDPTDWLTPGGLAKVGAILKGVLAPAAAVSTAMLVGSRAAGPTSQLQRSVGASQLGAFIGSKSTLWNKEKALLAEQELLKGTDPKEVWKKTGTFKTPEGLEQEISDSKMRLRPDFDNLPRDVLRINRQTNFPIGGIVEHPELYKAYPEILKNTRVDELTKLADWIPASSNTGSLHSGYGLVPAKIGVRNKTEVGALNTFSHEFQHYIDEIEGRGRGSTPGFTDEQFQAYLNNMSEARARLTANRRLLTEEERLATYPEFDRPVEDLVIGISNRARKSK